MQRYFNTIVNDAGTPLSGALVRVTQSSGIVASIYSDNGVTPAANPLVSDGSGNFQFFAANGTYTLTITYNGNVVKTLAGLVLGSDDASSTDLKAWAESEAFSIDGARDASGVLTSAVLTWPDTVTGTYAAVTQSTAFPGAVDVATLTYAGATTRTVTLTVLTRDSFGGALKTSASVA